MQTIKEGVELYPLTSLAITDDDGNSILTTGELKALLCHWSKWCCDDLLQDLTTYYIYAKSDFVRLWTDFQRPYNPVENYDKTSEITTVANRGDVEQSTSLGSTTTTSTAQGGNVTTNYATSFESTLEKETGKQVAEGSSITTGSGSDTATTKYKTITSGANTGNEINVMSERTHGNIGVKSGSQLLLEEYETRSKHLKFEFVKQFIGEFCYYVGGQHDDNNTL